MTIETSHNFRHIAVFGAGLSGRAAYQRALSLGVSCVIDDDSPIMHDAIAKSDICAWQEWDWSQIDALILSPGIAHNHPAPHPVASAARAHQTPIISEVEFGLSTGNWGKLVIITGTNGKSTTTALTGHLLASASTSANASVQIGGNLGTPLCALNEAPQVSGTHHITVLELSSYQLETTPSLAPDITALLNITPDHLDRHGGLDGYIAAKKISLSACPREALALIGDEGPIMQEVLAWAKDTLPCHIQAISADDLHARPLDNPYLAGAHNAQNASFAIAIAKACGIKETAIHTGLASFVGLAHRLQPVGAADGIGFVNDSKATNGDATAKALGAYDDIIWLAGGQAKADGLTACRPFFDHIHRAHFYGSSAAEFYQDAAPHIHCTTHETLDEAFEMAVRDLPSKAVILLSPAAASFDQFPNFGARGDHFSALAKHFITTRHKEAAHVG